MKWFFTLLFFCLLCCGCSDGDGTTAKVDGSSVAAMQASVSAIIDGLYDEDRALAEEFTMALEIIAYDIYATEPDISDRVAEEKFVGRLANRDARAIVREAQEIVLKMKRIQDNE